MPIDITPYFNYILDTVIEVINFCRTQLIFSLAGVTFNLFTLSIGIFIFYRSIAAIFGDEEEEDKVDL